MFFLLEHIGIVAALFAVTTIIYPTTLAGLQYKTEPLSTVSRNTWIGRVFRIGVVGTGILLIVFSITREIVFYGKVIYLASCVSMIVSGAIEDKTNNSFHTAATRLYFALSVVGELLISCSLESPLGILLSVAGGIGTLFLYYKLKWKSYSEYWGIGFAIVWVLTFSW